MDRARQEKVQRFEDFVDRRLKPDLVKAIAERLTILFYFIIDLGRDKVFEKQKIFSDLKRNIQTLEDNNVTSLKTMVNVGSEVYAQCEVPDTSRIFVDVGLGFHVEFTWSEALKFVSMREEKLAKEIEDYTQLISSIKSHIKLVLEGIRELLNLAD